MTEITIEKGIPIPPKSRRSKYPWEQMEIGDSFQVEGQKSVGFPKAFLEKGWEFERRTYQENGTDFVRVWRTK